MMKTKLLASTFAGMIALGAAGAAMAAPIVLDFEGLQNQEHILDFYNGGTGSLGSTGPNFGIGFGADAEALIASSAGGTGNFQGEPSAPTVAFFLTGTGDLMNVAAGFNTGFSFFYSAIANPGSVDVFSGLDGGGSHLAHLVLPTTPAGPYGVAPCPNTSGGAFCPWVPIGVSFAGTAESVNFTGTANQIGFDNITLGSQTPVVPSPLIGHGLLVVLAVGGVLLGSKLSGSFKKHRLHAA
jgi:hypothetical protein